MAHGLTSISQTLSYCLKWGKAIEPKSKSYIEQSTIFIQADFFKKQAILVEEGSDLIYMLAQVHDFVVDQNFK